MLFVEMAMAMVAVTVLIVLGKETDREETG